MNDELQQPAPLTPIAEYSATAAALAELKHKFGSVVFDVATKDGMQTAIKARAEIRTYRTSLEKKRVEIKAPALERARLIDAEAKRITAELLALEDPIDDVITAEQQRKERERAEKEEKEKARVAGIQDRIIAIAALPTRLVGKPSAEVAEALAHIRQETGASWAEEFQQSAEDTISRAIAALEQLHAGAKAQEDAAAAEAARVAAERVELERLRAEQAERDHQETARKAQAEAEARAAREKIEAEERAAREKIEAEERAAREKIEAEERASREKIEAEERQARLAREEADRKARIERDRLAAEARAEAQAKAEREAQEQAAMQAEADRVAEEQAERDRLLRVESDRIAAEKREIALAEQEILDGTALLRKFIERFGRRREFASVTKAIKSHLGE